jgi:anti-sigma B factor antagonist
MAEVTVADRTEGRDGMQATVVALDGELDSASAPAVQERLAALVPPDGRVVVDMTAVPYMSSAGLRTMLLLYRNAQAVGTTICLVGLSPELRQMMQATGFLGYFPVHDTVEDGLRELAPAEPARDGGAS